MKTSIKLSFKFAGIIIITIVVIIGLLALVDMIVNAIIK